MRVNYYIAVGLLALWMAIGCDSVVSDIHTLNGTWTLVAYENMLTRVLDPKPNEQGTDVTLTFSDDENEGTMMGISGPNQVSGSYLLTADYELEVVQYGGTKIGEPEWTAKSREAFPEATSYEVTPERMYIYYEGQRERMIFVKN